MTHPIELLAPARDLECGLAAIGHGADAVYIGGPRFGARQAAGNSIQDIAKLADYAHRFFARVYVAVNTLLDDRELEEAAALIHELWNCGVDAVIIQDLGLLQCNLPPMPLHASTQMDNRDPAWVAFLEKLGFAQVVLARELTLMEIAAIRAATSLPLEFFVHGSLCVSYSGRCFFSERVAGRSANRGECAQFCRHGYRLLDAKGNPLTDTRHLLSLCDLDLSAHLTALADAGVSSLKIEGRLKDAAYVKNITAFYRLAIDELLGKDSKWRRASSGRCQFDFTPNPEKTFHRGATDYFLVKRRNQPAAVDTVKSIGEELGTARAVRGKTVSVQTDKTVANIANGDGLCFFDRERHLIGFRVNRAESDTLHLAAAVPGLEAGSRLFRNHDSAFHRLLAGSDMPRKLAAKATVWRDEDNLYCRLEDEDGLVSTATLIAASEPAKTSGASERVRQQMSKTGGSSFVLNEIAVQMDEHAHYPAAIINELRRQTLASHLQLRALMHLRNKAKQPEETALWPENGPPAPPCLATNEKARQFIHRHGLPIATIEELPLMTCRYCIKNQLGWCPRSGEKAAGETPAKPLAEPLYLEDNAGRWRLEFDCGRCEMRLWDEKETSVSATLPPP
jgi:putative protease